MAVLRYLAYGSNLHPERLRRRTASASLVTTCVLHGWRLTFDKRGHDGSAKATITRTDGPAHRVHAAIYAMSMDEKPLLDRIEGLNQGYHEHVLSLPGIGRVWTYLAQAEYTDEALLPFRWYRNLVVAGARFHGFPGDYVASLSAQAIAEDPEPARQREHDIILEAMGG